MYEFDKFFKRYEEFDPKVPVWCLTQGDGCYTHRFFDTVPLSPSGRYLAVLDMPYEDKCAEVGDEANVVMVDLFTGEEKVVYKTKGWQHQLGANINWGKDDNSLIFNDVDMETLKGFAVNLNPHTGETIKLQHEIYHVSPDGLWGVSSDLTSTWKTQYGYGVSVPYENIKNHTIFTEDDGVWLTNTQSGETKLLLSLKEIYERTHTELERFHYSKGLCYVFHTKWSPNGEKILFSTRYIREGYTDGIMAGRGTLVQYCVYTCNVDGSELEVAVDEGHWAKNGHHINWSPDSKYLTMNLDLECTGLKLCKASLKGRHIEKLIEDVPGSGHPSLHKTKNLMIADTYAGESKFKDGTVPIRLVDLDNRIEFDTPIRINVAHPGAKIASDFRVDPHVVWDRSGRYCLFNGHVDGHRRVYIADMQKYLED